MSRKKFNLLILNLLVYLLYSTIANESSEEEYNCEEEYSAGGSEYLPEEDSDFLHNKKSKDKEGSLSLNKINDEKEERTYTNCQAKKKLAQINECQKKLFGNEIEIRREFNLDKETQMIIIDNYFNENLEFKQAFEDYKKTCLKENQRQLMTKNDNFLNFFYSSTEINYLEAKEENHKLAYNLIEKFKEYNETPREFYNLDLNKKYSKNTKKMITGKVEEFIKNYIDGQLKVFVDRLKRN
uniref:Uncharacterized protein n=1 Tax=Meloidogyne floridensis TaxID=298350 RepID=A0A915PB75_9BILA